MSKKSLGLVAGIALSSFLVDALLSPADAMLVLACQVATVGTPKEHKEDVTWGPGELFCWYEEKALFPPRPDDYWNFEHFGGVGAGGQPNPGEAQQGRDGAEKGCGDQVGNPVVVSTGNKVESNVDFSASGEVGLYLRRTYNSYRSDGGLFGAYWLTNFDYSMVTQGQAAVWMYRPDGRRIRYPWNEDHSRFEEDKAGAVAYVERIGIEFTHYTEDQMIEKYKLGYIQSVKNRQGIGWTFSYTNNYLQTVTHTSGRTVTLTWDNGRLIKVTDPDGAVFEYGYDLNAFGAGKHRLSSVILPGPPATQVAYHYEKPGFPGALTSIFIASSRYANFSYDDQGRTLSSEHVIQGGVVDHYDLAYQGASRVASDPPPPPSPPGAQCDPITGLCQRPEYPLAPDEDAQLLAQRAQIADAAAAILAQPMVLTQVTVTNPLGKQAIYSLDGRRITQTEGLPSTHCAGTLTLRDYDTRGYPAVYEDAEAHQTTYGYNDQGQTQSITEAFGSPVARTTSFDWDVVENRLESVTVEGDHRESFAWRGDGRLESTTMRNLSDKGVTDQDHVTAYAYTFHPNGMVASVIEDGPLPGTGDAVKYEYDAQGNLTRLSNSLSHESRWSQQNNRGQPGRIVGVNGEAIEYDYDARGRIIHRRTFRNNATQQTDYVYAASGLLESITTPDGVTESHVYDGARRRKTTTRNDPDGTQVREWFYDAASNPIQEEVRHNGILLTRVEIDYDELDRVRARRGNHAQETGFGYDGNGNLTTISRVLGADTTLEYDELNRLKTQIDPENGNTRFQYDHGDRIVRVIDPRNRTTTWGYDGFGQLWSYSNPDTGTTTQQWNAAGQRSSALRADGVAISYAYDDPLGRPTTVTAGTGAQAVAHTTVWDSGPNCGFGKGRICRIDDPHQSLELGYERYGELGLQRPTIAGQANYLHRFKYDGLGRLYRIEYPGNVNVDYNWTLDRITAMTATVAGQVRTVIGDLSITGDSLIGVGTRRLLTYGNGRYREERFDTDGRLYATRSDLGHGLDLGFDANDRITSVVNLSQPTVSQTYGYDDLDRLTSVVSGLGNQGFDHDASGNRITHTQGGSTRTYAIAAASNRLDTISGGLNRSYTYKPSGQVKSITGPLSQMQLTEPDSAISEGSFGALETAGTASSASAAGAGPGIFADGFEVASAPPTYQFSYDIFNRLSGISGPGLAASYQIAATGMRVAKTVNGQTTRFVYGLGGQLLYEQDTQTSRRTQYLYLHGQPVALVRNDTVYWVQTDHLTRPEVITNQAGTSVWRANLEAFNRHVTTDTIGGYHLGFPGQYHDSETGFAYNIQRDYDPATGRYLQSDPIGLAGGINTYGYVGGNPVGFVDPLGLLCDSFISRVNDRFIETNKSIPGTFALPGMGIISAGASARAVGAQTMMEAATNQIANGLANYAHVATGTVPPAVNWAGALRGAALNFVAVSAAFEAGLYTGSAISLGLDDAMYGPPLDAGICDCAEGGGR